MVVCCDNETGGEARLKWSGHVQRRDSGYTGQRMWNMECLAGREEEGLANSWIKEDKRACVTEADAWNMVRWW